MKNLIPIEIYDISKTFTRFSKKERYSVLIEFGVKSYYFSSLKSAKKFATSFSKKLTKILSSVVSLLPNFTQYVLSFSPSISHKKSSSFLSDITDVHSSYLDLIHGIQCRHVFPRVFFILETIDRFVSSLSSSLRVNNRYRFLSASLSRDLDIYSIYKASLNAVLYDFSVDSSVSKVIYHSNLKAV